MKILLLGFVRISNMPYMVDYKNMLAGSNELHLVSWNRSGKEDLPAPEEISKSFVFNDRMEDEDPLKQKLPHIYRYRCFVKKIIKREKYDKIIVLHSTPGVALLDYLARHYKGKYLLDYRDVSHEKISIYRKLILKLSRNAGLVLASSPAFMKYLDNAQGVFLKHNLLVEEETVKHEETKGPIRVRYWGMIRHEAANLMLIDELGNDGRFELHYNGREEIVAERLKKHVEEKGFTNVFFHGAYYNDERPNFAAETDIIHNIYENDFVTIGAMGNKYYDGIQFKVPQLCSKGSIMGDEVTVNKLGIAIDYSKSGFKEELVTYMANLDREMFEMACDRELASIEHQNEETNKRILSFF